MSTVLRTISVILLAALCVVFVFSAFAQLVFAQPSYTMNYQGKLTDNTGLAVANGTYQIEFNLYTQASGGSPIWTETRSGGNEVTVTNGLFSVMLGSVSSLTGVNFNQPLYLGVTVEADAEMTPRKAIGTVPSAFEARQLGGVASTSFLRSDAADTASGLLTFTGGLISSASSTVARLSFLNATGTSLYIGGDRITEFAGTNLEVSGNALRLSSTYTGQNTITTLGTIATGVWQGTAITSTYLDTSVILSSEIDSCSEIATIVGSGATGSCGNLVLSNSPTLTGTLTAADADFSGIVYLGSNSYISSTGVFRTVTGAVGAPSYAFENDTNTGIYNPGDGIIRFSSNAADAMSIIAGGNVGIGTTTPNQKLTVEGNINLSANTGAIYFDDTKYLYASSTNDSIVFGEDAGATFTSGTTNNIAIGFNAGRYASSSDSDNSIYLGAWAGQFQTGGYNNLIGEGVGGSNSGWDNHMIGFYAGFNNTGDLNNVMGYLTADSNSGSTNNIFGSRAGYNNSGDYNNILGRNTGYNNSGSYNNFLGQFAGYSNTGNLNDFIGSETGRYLQSTSTVALGAEALYGSHATTYISLNNVALGYRAGYASDDGSGNNILIGYQAADNLTTGNNNIIIGYDIDSISATADNVLNIGNLIFGTGLDGTGTTLASGNVGIGTTTPSDKLEIYNSAAYDTGVTVRNPNSDAAAEANFKAISNSGTLYMGIHSAAYGYSSGAAYLWNAANTALYFGTNDTERMRITADGSIGIGTTTPTRRLELYGASAGSAVIRLDEPRPRFEWRESDASSNNRLWRMEAEGSVWSIAAQNDALTQTNAALSITRSGATPSNIYTGDLRLGVNDSGPDFRTEIVSTAGSGYFGVTNSSDGDIFMISTTGNVGIGTTSPYARLSTQLTSTSATAADTYASAITMNDTGVITTGTDRITGQKIEVNRSGSTGGTMYATGQEISLLGGTTGATGHLRGLSVESSPAGGITSNTGAYIAAYGGTYAVGADIYVDNAGDGSSGLNVAHYDFGSGSTNTKYGMSVTFDDSGSSAGTDTNYATYVDLTSWAESGATSNSYGQYITADVQGGGTVNGYGQYINLVGGTTGTSVNYGSYINVSGADTNYSGIFMGGNFGIGDATPSALFTVGNGDLFTINSSGVITSSNNITPNSILSTGQTDEYCLTYESTGTTFEWQTCGGSGSLFTDGGATTYLTATGDFLGVGTTTANHRLTVEGNINLSSATGAIYFDDTKYLYASSTNDSVVFGENAGATFTSGTTWNVAIGLDAGRYASSSNADYNVYIGMEAGYNNTNWGNNLIGYGAGYNNTGEVNNLIGNSAGYSNTGSYNNIFGYYAGSNNTGSSNEIIGLDAGSENAGDENQLIGLGSGYFNTGDGNSFLGLQTGRYNNGDFNAFMGYQTGEFLKSTSTVAIGAEALYGYNSGATARAFSAINNTAVGYRAGYNATTTANNNILIGYQAADNLTTGNNNIIIGYDIDNVTATTDNALNIGNLIFGTGLDGTGTTLASGNVGIGTTTPSAKLDVWGDFRVGTGTVPTLSVNTADDVVIFSDGTSAKPSIRFAGANSGFFQYGTNDIGVVMNGVMGWIFNNQYFQSSNSNGARIITGASGNSETIPVFTRVGDTDTGIYMSVANELGVTTGGVTRAYFDDAGNVGIGTTTPASKLDVYGFVNVNKYSGYKIDGRLLAYASSTNYSTLFGIGAGGQNATTSATKNYLTAVGYNALKINTTGKYNTAIGPFALANNTLGSHNIAIGSSTLGTLSSADNNTAIGDGALASNAFGGGNTAIGYEALFSATAVGNTAVGEGAGYGVTGSNNLFLGKAAGRYNTSSGDNNIVMGYQAGYAGVVGSYNTMVGYQAGLSGPSGANNSLFGANAGYNLTSGYSNTIIGDNNQTTGGITSGDGNIGIGSNIFFESVTGNRQLNIGNILFGQLPATSTSFTVPTTGGIGIGTTTPNQRLTIFKNGADAAIEFSTVSGANEKWTIGIDDSDAAKFKISSSSALGTSDRLTIDGGGKIGINDSTPDAYLDIDTPTTYTSGTIYQAGAAGATTLAGALTGMNLNLGTNYTATNQSITGYDVSLPAVTNTGSSIYRYKGLEISSGALVQNTTSGSTYFTGVDVTNPNVTQTTGAATASGIQVTTGTITTGGTQRGLYVLSNGIGAGTTNGVELLIQSPGAGTETAINISSSWDNAITVGTTAFVVNGSGVITSSNNLTPNAILSTGQADEECLTYEATGSTFEWQSCSGGSFAIDDLTDAIVDGSANMFLGAGVGASYTGSYSVGLGYLALQDGGSGWQQTAIGSYALNALASGELNTAIGAGALEKATSTSYNTALGGLSLWQVNGGSNTALGERAGYGGSLGAPASNNVFVGMQAGEGVISANYNTMIGYQAGQNITTADDNIFIGYQAGINGNGLASAAAVGYQAGYEATGNNNAYFGRFAGYSNAGSENFIAGTESGTYSDGDYANVIGYRAAYNATTSIDFSNIMGYYAGNYSNGSNNNIFGAYAGENVVGGSNNLFGYGAGTNSIGGDNNFIGSLAGENTNGGSNNFIGYHAGQNADGSYNNYIGYNAAVNLSGNNNTVLGTYAMTGDSGAYTGDTNVAIGYGAGYYANGNASNNILIGALAGEALTTGDNNIVIGYDIDLPNNAGNNQLNIGNIIYGTSIDGSGTTLSTGNIGIGTTTPYAKFAVTNTGTGHSFLVEDSSSDTSPFVIDASGNVGIGTTSPATLLQVSAGGALPSLFSGTAFVVNRSTSASTNAQMAIISGTTGTAVLAFGDTALEKAGGITYDNNTNSFMFRTNATDDRMVITSSGNVGIGTSSPNARFSVQNTGFTGAGVIGTDQWYQSTNSTLNAVQYGNRNYLTFAGTATTTMVGSMFRFADNTTYGNTVRGLEVQTNQGSNPYGENTAISGSGRTFGIRGITSGNAGSVYEPAGGFFQTNGTTQGNAIRGYSSTITSATLLSLFQDTSAFTGTGLEMNFGNSSGSFNNSSSLFIDLQNAGTSVFTVGAHGTTTIGNGTNYAGLQIGRGGLCVDNDGACTAGVAGRIASVSTFTGNSDLAEMYFSSSWLEAGEIVTLKGELSIDRAEKGDDMPVLGVVSTKPGLLLGADDTSLTQGERGYPVALRGRVPIKLSTENGPIKKGDSLTLSSIPGVAMKATEGGTIVGTALEDFDDSRLYSDTYINQFGDDIAEEVFEPIVSNDDPRIHDGCYYGGGTETGKEPCVPLKGYTPEQQLASANEIVRDDVIRGLRGKSSETETLENGQEVRVGQIVMFVDLNNAWFAKDQMASIASLFATSSVSNVGDNENESLFDRVKNLANSFVDGVLSVFKLKADRVEVKEELCVDGICIDGDDLRELLQNNNVSGSTPSPEPEPEPPEESVETESDGDDAGSSPETGGEVVEESPVSAPESEPEKSPEVSEPDPEPSPEPEPEPPVEIPTP